MRYRLPQWRRTLLVRHLCSVGTQRGQASPSPALVNIDNATFYRQFPSSKNTDKSQHDAQLAFFPNLSFSLPANASRPHQYWSVLSSSAVARTTFLQILNGRYICTPPNARTYPAFQIAPDHAIKYVGFDAERRGGGLTGADIQGSHLSARYESHREATDFTLWQYLMGQTELNALERRLEPADHAFLEHVSEQLNLKSLLEFPVSNLSNGQTRRAKIAKGLMSRPALLLLDGPFMGLDPYSARSLSAVLESLASKNAPRLFLSLRPEDDVPAWITHLVEVNASFQVDRIGPVAKHSTRQSAALKAATGLKALSATDREVPAQNRPVSLDGHAKDSFHREPSDLNPVVEMQGVQISYGSKPILGHWKQTGPDASPGLHWTISRGERWSIFGPNGSGKTTLLSLMTSDHPQTYSLPIKLFGRSRLPSLASGETGISVFELQRRIGHSSPEVHAFFPKRLSLRRTIESAFADAPLAKPILTDSNSIRKIDRILRWFENELNPARQGQQFSTPFSLNKYMSTDRADLEWTRQVTFGELPFSSQRLVLFLRALVHSPDLLILDEAFGGMDAHVRDKAMLFMSFGETKRHVLANGMNQREVADSSVPIEEVLLPGLTPNQALVTISHSKEDVPGCVDRWICLPEPETGGMPPRWGRFPGPLELHPECWNDIWGLDTK